MNPLTAQPAVPINVRPPNWPRQLVPCPACRNKLIDDAHERLCPAATRMRAPRHDQIRDLLFRQLAAIPGCLARREPEVAPLEEDEDSCPSGPQSAARYDISFSLSGDPLPSKIDVTVAEPLAPMYASRAIKGEAAQQLEERKYQKYGRDPLFFPFSLTSTGQLAPRAKELMDVIDKAYKNAHLKWPRQFFLACLGACLWAGNHEMHASWVSVTTCNHPSTTLDSLPVPVASFLADPPAQARRAPCG
eukprot:GAFH01003034.1.p2 GENE.GAFH01003034.1~~GAFH01003034.1.p2  ORF type:complete len:247 (-),score=65.57 GAFH01003034.1:94-834(-)